MVLRDHVSAIDELAMATERLRVRHPDEPKPNPPVLHIIEPHEVNKLTGKRLIFFFSERISEDYISKQQQNVARSVCKVCNMSVSLLERLGGAKKNTVLHEMYGQFSIHEHRENYGII